VQRGSALFIGVFAFILNPDPAQRLQGQKKEQARVGLPRVVFRPISLALWGDGL
jgi:hypothetical protein